MTWQFDVNNLGLGTGSGNTQDHCGEMLLGLINLLVANGAASVVGSGDGVSTFENTGQTAGPYNVLTGGATIWNTVSSNTFSATEAWVRFKMTGTTLEFIIHRHTSTSITFKGYLKIKISPTGFNSNDADANTPPTATDEQYIHGTSSTYINWIDYNVDMRWHAACEDTAQDGFYPFYLAILRDSDKDPRNAFLFDVVQSKVDGDSQPWVIYQPEAGDGFDMSEIGASWGHGYKDYGGGTETFLESIRAHLITDHLGSDLFPGIAVQPDGKARSFPLIWGHPTGPFYKGISRNFAWKGLNVDYPSTANLSTVDAKIFIDDIMLPWKQSEVPL